MQNKFYKHNIIAVFTIAFAMIASCGTCQYLLQRNIVKSNQIEKVQSGEIDWGNECYYARGEAVMQPSDEEPNRSRAQLKARGSAKTKAIANLIMAVENTPINCKAIGKDYIIKDSHLQQAIENFAASAEVVEEKLRSEGDDTVVMVTVKAPMYGAGSVGSAVLLSKFQLGSSEIPSSGLKLVTRGDTKAPTYAADAKGPFTSLIIDCSGLDIQRAINPKIRRPDKKKNWGAPSSNFEFLQERGMVSYVKNLDEARKHASGNNPLVIKAVGLAGARFNCDVIVSDPDADLLLQENLSSKFMDKSCVIFIGALPQTP